MDLADKNLALIGMPGAGKSSIGVALALALSAPFLDTDRLIEGRWGCSLQQIIQRAGLDAFRKAEEEVIVSLSVRGYVIATGGSVVYSDPAMAHLLGAGWVIWLQLPLREIQRRIQKGMEGRGIVRHPTQTLDDLYRERRPLYERYAQMVVDASKDDPQVVGEILEWLDGKTLKG